MNYFRLVKNAPEKYSVGQLRRDNPNISFPENPSDTFLAGWGVYPYTVQGRPKYDRSTQAVTASVIAEVNGAWVQGWEITNLLIEDAGRNVRSLRDNLLAQTDWMAVSDVVMAPEWAEYRQALREITDHPGFPYAVVWPIKPE